MKIILLISALFLMVGCATKEIRPADEPASKVTPSFSADPGDRAIDFVALQRSLGLDRNAESLGYREKSFNTCEAGYGYSRSQDCRKQHFVVIHYRLQCRDSEGTVSQALSADDLRPISNRDIKWNLKGREGISRTDSDGFGQIRAVFPASQKRERLKLATNGDFLYLRAEEIDRIVTPKNWCPY